jgi:hypothetical protein
MDNMMGTELEMEIKALRSEIDKLNKENKDLKQVLSDNDLADEASIERVVSPEEEICVIGIEQILELVRNKVSDVNDIKNYDILHKNLRLIRNQKVDDKAPAKKANLGDLLKIVEGKNG